MSLSPRDCVCLAERLFADAVALAGPWLTARARAERFASIKEAHLQKGSRPRVAAAP